MKTFTKPFRGVRAGDIYPTDFAAGDECPPELEAGAHAVGALAEGNGEGSRVLSEKETLIAQLEAAGIKFDKRWNVEKLTAALGVLEQEPKNGEAKE